MPILPREKIKTPGKFESVSPQRCPSEYLWQRMDCLSLPVCGILWTITWHSRPLCHHLHLWRIRANWNPSAVTAIKARLLAVIEGSCHFSNYTSFTWQRKESLAKDLILGKYCWSDVIGVCNYGLGEGSGTLWIPCLAACKTFSQLCCPWSGFFCSALASFLSLLLH